MRILARTELRLSLKPMTFMAVNAQNNPSSWNSTFPDCDSSLQSICDGTTLSPHYFKYLPEVPLYWSKKQEKVNGRLKS